MNHALAALQHHVTGAIERGEAVAIVEHVKCNPCMGRGYKPENRKSGKGFYARTCRSCGGTGPKPA